MVRALDRQARRSIQLVTNVTRLHHAMPLSPEIVKAISDLVEGLRKAIDVAKAAGLPQGLIVALLHGQGHSQTAMMVNWMAAKLLEFKREGWWDAARNLRKIADDLESGEREACSVGVIGMRTESSRIDVFGFGPMADDMQSLALFRLGEPKLIEIILEHAEG